MSKKRTGCPGFVSPCDPADFYHEQNLKKMVVDLPPGLLADANAAAEYCDPYQNWLVGGGDPRTEQYSWICRNPNSLLGSIYMKSALCRSLSTGEIEIGKIGCTDFFGSGIAMQGPGLLFNDRPRRGEQAHLVALWIADEFQQKRGKNTPAVRTDISVRVRESDLGITAVADGIPDLADFVYRKRGCSACTPFTYRYGAQPSNISVTLDGDTGVGKGHSLLSNLAACDVNTIGVQFQGYARNSIEPVHDPGKTTPASGNGKVVGDTVPYQATGCDKVPYNPNLNLSLDDLGPEAAPGISAKVTQAYPASKSFVDEQTTKKVTTTFPRGFKVNVNNTATHCSDADLAARSCPESSRIGTVEAKSRLLQAGQTFTGNVYLAGLTGDSVKVAALLRGRVQKGADPTNIRIDASGKVLADGRLQTTFDNLPQVPIKEFTLNLEGGAKGLIKTPKVCGPQEVTATFESHAGKTVTTNTPFEIKGCADPTLDVELSNRRKGERTDLDLSLGSTGVAIKQVEFRVARQLHWGMRKPRGVRKGSAARTGRTPRSERAAYGERAAFRRRNGARSVKKAKRLRSIGTATFTTTQGERKVRLKAKRTKRGNLSFVPLVRKKKGQLVAAQVPNFVASLFRTARRQPSLVRKGKGKGKRKRGRRQSDLVVRGLPGEGLTAVDLSLRGKDGRRTFFLRNPIGCKRPLNFVAIVTAEDGKRLALKDQVRLRGKGCKRKKKSR